MAEQLTLVRAHLEEAEVLAVLCGRRQPGLAPAPRRRLPRSSEPNTLQIAAFGGIAAKRRASRARTFERSTATVFVQLAPRAVPRTRASSRPRRGDRSTLRSVRCVLKNRIVPRYFRIATSLRSSCWSRVGAGRAMLALRGVGVEGACIAAAAACVTRTNASRPTSRTLKRFPPERGQGRGPHGRRSCLSIGARYTTRHESSRSPYKELRKRVTSVTGA